MSRFIRFLACGTAIAFSAGCPQKDILTEKLAAERGTFAGLNRADQITTAKESVRLLRLYSKQDQAAREAAISEKYRLAAKLLGMQEAPVTEGQVQLLLAHSWRDRDQMHAAVAAQNSTIDKLAAKHQQNVDGWSVYIDAVAAEDGARANLAVEDSQRYIDFAAELPKLFPPPPTPVRDAAPPPEQFEAPHPTEPPASPVESAPAKRFR